MDLIDRYVVAVRRHLPRPLQQDIADELSENLRSEADALAQRFGRALTAGDQEQMLKSHGHPWLMASRYLPQQQLVGPALFPYYRQAITLVLFWVVLPITLGGGALAAVYAQHAGHTWARALGAAWNGSIYSVGFITIVFAVLESQRVRITALDNWKPAALPEPQDGRAVPRGESLFSLITSITFLMLWTDVIRMAQLVEMGTTPVRLVPDPVWATVYFPILLSLLVTIAASFVDLMRPWRTLLFSVTRIANALAVIAIVAIVLRARHWVSVVADAAFADQAARADHWLNATIEWSLIIVAGITLFEAVREIWQVYRSRRGRA